MSDPSLEAQDAILAALKSSDALPSTVGGRVFDTAPKGATFPYVTLGPCQVLPDKADCIDGAELFLQVDVWSRSVGWPEAKTIAAAVKRKLDDQPLEVEGHNVIVFEHQSTSYIREQDGLTQHAAITFRSLIQPN